MRPFGDVKQIVSAGMDALLLYFNGESIDVANAHCQRWQVTIAQANFPWLIECVPAYDSLLIVFDPLIVDSHQVYQALSKLPHCREAVHGHINEHALPVWYGGEGANDLALVAEKTGLSEAQIIQTHSSMTYKVYAVGFAPGFAYMGHIPEALQCERLATPRKLVPKGAVAIADRQTAVYPSASPGGWHLLGLCPLNLIDAVSLHSRLKVGDTVKFVSISEQEFRALYEG